MGCPGGCVNGGDQPYVKELFLPQEDDDIMDTYIAKRAKALYEEDELSTIRRSHLNPDIQELYKKYLIEPGSILAHKLLHTHIIIQVVKSTQISMKKALSKANN